MRAVLAAVAVVTVVLLGASAVATPQSVQADPAGRVSAAACGRHGTPYELALARVAVALHRCRAVHRPASGTPAVQQAAATVAAAAARPAPTHRAPFRWTPRPTPRITTPVVTTPTPVVTSGSPGPTTTTSVPPTVPAGFTAAFGS
ncbi:MAG TPA: hypothetical protein VGO26_00840, partial [Amnibacterium sp.]|nr:hypothetical protein [Amnibacterium sp.]